MTVIIVKTNNTQYDRTLQKSGGQDSKINANTLWDDDQQLCSKTCWGLVHIMSHTIITITNYIWHCTESGHNNSW